MRRICGKVGLNMIIQEHIESSNNAIMHLKLGTQDFTELGEYGDMPELYSELRPCVSTYSRMTTYTYVTYIHVMYFTTYIYI